MESLDIMCQSLKHPFWTSCIHQCQAVIRAPPVSPLCQIMCSEQSMLLGLADYSTGRKRDRRGREGGREQKKRETWRERKRQGRRGSESATTMRVAKQDKSSGGTPPLVRWTSPPHSLLLPLLLLLSPSPFFPPPRFFSIIHQCAESPQHTAPAAVAPVDPSSLLDSPPHIAWLQRLFYPQSAIYPSILEHGD